MNEQSNEEHIDRMAREAGSALRRPAPADQLAGLYRAQRARRTRLAAAGGTMAVIIAAVGVWAATRPDDGTTETTDPPGVTDSTTPSATSNPAVVAPPDRVYFASNDGDVDTQQVVDAASGEVLGTEPLDLDRFTAAHPLVEATEVTASGVRITLEFIETGSDDALTDACGGRAVLVEGGGRGQLPDVARLVTISDDGRSVVMIWTENCPDSAVPFTWNLGVFDGTDLGAAPRILSTGENSDGFNWFTAVDITADGNWAVFTHDGLVPGTAREVQVYQLATGERVPDPAPECEVDGLGTTSARWVFSGVLTGDAIVAYTVDCDGATEVVLQSLAGEPISDPQELRVPLPEVDRAASVSVEVYAPSIAAGLADTWFVAFVDDTFAEDFVPTAFVVRGSTIVQTLSVDDRASFLPMWYTPGD